MNQFIALQQDPFQPYDAAAKKPKVPEPSTYGAIFMALILVFVFFKRRKIK